MLLMIYKDNKQLTVELKKLLLDVGVSQRQLSQRLEILPQALVKILDKKHLSFADLARILAPLGYNLHFDFVKTE